MFSQMNTVNIISACPFKTTLILFYHLRLDFPSGLLLSNSQSKPCMLFSSHPRMPGSQCGIFGGQAALR